MSSSRPANAGTGPAEEGPIRWAILGVGQAGRRRMAAIQNDPRSELVAVWRGRFAKAAGVPITDSAEDAIGLADAVYVCSPLEVHAEQIEMSISSGRSVVSEYPLATAYDEAAALLQLARARGVVLHVGHIELLSGVARTLSAHMRPTDVRKAELFFSGAGPKLPGHALAYRNVARLHRLLAVTGPVQAITRVEPGDGELIADLQLKSGRPAALAFRQAPGLPRQTIMEITTFRNRWRQVNRDLYLDGTPTTVLDPGSVFEADHRAAVRRILDHASPYVSEARILEVLAIAERLQNGVTGEL